jgi:hypothetical protein
LSEGLHGGETLNYDGTQKLEYKTPFFLYLGTTWIWVISFTFHQLYTVDKTSRIHWANYMAGFDVGKMKKLPAFTGYFILTTQLVASHFAY